MINSITQVLSQRVSNKNVPQELLIAVTRAAFISRFIVLREGRRSRAHRKIEKLAWTQETTAEEIYEKIRECFIENGDKLTPVDRDLRRALEHAKTAAPYFISQYANRLTLNFRESLKDYQKSNSMFFENEDSEALKTGGWRFN